MKIVEKDEMALFDLKTRIALEAGLIPPSHLGGLEPPPSGYTLTDDTGAQTTLTSLEIEASKRQTL